MTRLDASDIRRNWENVLLMLAKKAERQRRKEARDGEEHTEA